MKAKSWKYLCLPIPENGNNNQNPYAFRCPDPAPRIPIDVKNNCKAHIKCRITSAICTDTVVQHLNYSSLEKLVNPECHCKLLCV